MSRANLWRAGYCAEAIHGAETARMQQIDAGYLYELGALIRPIGSIGFDITHPWQAWRPMTAGRDAIQQFLQNSIYSSGLRSVQQYGQVLLEELQAIITRIENGEWGPEDEFPKSEVLGIARAFGKFEPVMIAEMQSASIFYVPPRGAFDNAYLINAGERLFPESLGAKAPEALGDIQQGARCLAFDLPTASGFHFHRGNEAVLRRYFDHVAGASNRPAMLSMGTLLAELRKLDLGDKNVIAALDNIKEFHRNPLMHPEHTLANTDEAISLYCAIRSAMSYMLDKLPSPSLPALTPSP